MAPRVTLAELVEIVNEFADTEAEAVATVVYLVNSGHVRLTGELRRCRVDLGPGRAALGALGAA